jgi:hypothetical protein
MGQETWAIGAAWRLWPEAGLSFARPREAPKDASATSRDDVTSPSQKTFLTLLGQDNFPTQPPGRHEGHQVFKFSKQDHDIFPRR